MPRCQVFIFKIFRMQHLHQRIAEKEFVLAVVKTPCHFLQVGWKMFHGNFMPRSNYAALEQGERRLDCVRGHSQPAFVPNVFLFFVVDGLVLALKLRRVEIVEFGFVGHDHINSFVDVPRHDLVDFVLIQVAGGNEMQMTAPLPDANYGLMLLPLIRVLSVTADIHLIHFDSALELMVRFFHCLANSMAEIPCCLVRDAEHSFDLISGHALARFGHQIGHEKPFRQGQVRIVEDRSNGNRELVFA